MTTRLRIEYVNGNKDIEVVDLRDGSTAATLTAPGDVFEQNIHGDAQFTVRETGEFHGAAKQQGMQANATVDENNTDAGQYASNRAQFGSDANPAEGSPERYESDPLPPGAGDNGSNVEDVRVGDGAPKNSI